jgi:hypothetical protein
MKILSTGAFAATIMCSLAACNSQPDDSRAKASAFAPQAAVTKEQPMVKSELAQVPAVGEKAAVSGIEYRASDGSFTCRIPAGWKARGTDIGGTTVQVFEPENGGEERMLISAMPSSANNAQELAQQAIPLVTQQLMPGLRLAAMPDFPQEGDVQAVEIRYVGMAASGGQVSWWHGLMLKDGIALGVLGGARTDRAPAVEQLCRGVLQSMRPSKVQSNTPPAAAIIGRWSYYSRSGMTGGSVNKQIVFYPNGRFEYTATTYMPDVPSDIDPTTSTSGTYQLNGNILTARADNGQQATYTLESVSGGGLRINGELFIREQ